MKLHARKLVFLCDLGLAAGCGGRHRALHHEQDAETDSGPEAAPADGDAESDGPDARTDADADLDGDDEQDAPAGEDASDSEDAQDGGDADEAWVPCPGDYLPSGHQIDLTGHGLVTQESVIRTPSGWSWMHNCEEEGFTIERASPAFDRLDEPIPVDWAPLEIEDALPMPQTRCPVPGIYDLESDSWFIGLGSTGPGGEWYAMITDAEGVPKTEPLAVLSSLPESMSILYATDGDEFVVLGMEVDLPSCLTWLTQVRVSFDGTSIETTDPVPVTGVMNSSSWREGGWSILGRTECTSPDWALWRLLGDGTVEGPTAITGFEAQTMRAFSSDDGPWVILYAEPSEAPGADIRYLRVDPVTGEVVTPDRLLLEIECDWAGGYGTVTEEPGGGYAFIYPEWHCDPSYELLEWFVRFTGDGEITQRTLLLDSPFGGFEYHLTLLEWVGDRFAVQWYTPEMDYVVEQFVCSPD